MSINSKKTQNVRAPSRRASPSKKVGRKVPEKAAPGGKAPPKKSAGTFVALLRGVNVGGNKRVPMADLCRIAGQCGFREVESYVQSGNLVFSSFLETEAAEAALERAIFAEFGFGVEVIVRSAADWLAYAEKSPFRAAETERPHLLHIVLSKRKASPGALRALAPYAKAGERLELSSGALWIDFRSGVARSKLTPAVLDRLVGSTVTARNFRTVQKLADMLGSRGRPPA